MTKGPSATVGVTRATAKIGYAAFLYGSPANSIPTTRYDDLLAAKATYPNVPMMVITNVSNGAGTSTNAILAGYYVKFRAAGIRVIGYVASQDGTRNLIGPDPVNGSFDQNRGMEQAIDAWAALYNIDGIMLDNTSGIATATASGCNPCPGGSTMLQYYQAVLAYIQSKGYTTIMNNTYPLAPGMTSATGIILREDIPTGFGGGVLPDPATLATWTTANGGDSTKYALIVVGPQTPPSLSYLQSIQNYLSWIYVTDNTTNSTYQYEPTYQSTTIANLSQV